MYLLLRSHFEAAEKKSVEQYCCHFYAIDKGSVSYFYSAIIVLKEMQEVLGRTDCVLPSNSY
jgi:hypothetical protein